jgi:hypothetical protein
MNGPVMIANARVEYYMPMAHVELYLKGSVPRYYAERLEFRTASCCLLVTEIAARSLLLREV